MNLIDAEIKRLRDPAAEYQDAARRLLRAADGMENGDSTAPTKAEPMRHTAVAQSTIRPGTRKEELVTFLKANPGSKRSKILAGTNIPVGTISFLLKAENGFESRGKKWFNKEN